MKVKELISHLMTKDIYVVNAKKRICYSNDGGRSFRRGVLGNPDAELTNKIYNCTVLWLTPRSNCAVSIMIEE